MKKIYLFLIAMVMVSAVFAQKVNVDIKKGPAPTLDGIEDEVVWEKITPVVLEKNFGTEEPSVDAYWKAYYSDEFIYVFLNVEDDEHLPAWVSGESAHWEWDKPEIYFDANNVLVDGLGAKNAGDGHHQYASPFEDGKYDTPYMGGDMGGVVEWCYTQVGEGYSVEYAFPISAITQSGAVVLDLAGIKALPENLGFDVTVIDRETGDAARKRKVWQSSDAAREAWGNMDDAGTIKLVEGELVGVKSLKSASMNVYPNPVIDNLTINAKFNKVVISNLVGQQVKSIETSNKTINVSDLSKGVYVVKAFNDGKQVGTAKITKN